MIVKVALALLGSTRFYSFTTPELDNSPKADGVRLACLEHGRQWASFQKAGQPPRQGISAKDRPAVLELGVVPVEAGVGDGSAGGGHAHLARPADERHLALALKMVSQNGWPKVAGDALITVTESLGLHPQGFYRVVELD